MPRLLDIQRGMQAAILGRRDGRSPPDAPTLDAMIDGRGLPADRRLAIHRNTTRITLTEALATTYPVVARLVGEEFFAHLAGVYLQAHPPRHGCLLDLGAGFAAVLAAHPSAETLPYLADVARLEWAWHQVLHEAEDPALSPSDLAALGPEGFATLVLAPLPAARLITSPWPVETIWRANQPEITDPPPLSLDQGPTRLLVLRPGVDVLFLRLSVGEAALVAALFQEAPLGEAAAVATAADPEFDLGPAMARLLGLGVFRRGTA